MNFFDWICFFHWIFWQDFFFLENLFFFFLEKLLRFLSDLLKIFFSFFRIFRKNCITNLRNFVSAEFIEKHFRKFFSPEFIEKTFRKFFTVNFIEKTFWKFFRQFPKIRKNEKKNFFATKKKGTTFFVLFIELFLRCFPGYFVFLRNKVKKFSKINCKNLEQN